MAPRAPVVPWLWRLLAASVWLFAATLLAVLSIHLLLRPEGGLLLVCSLRLAHAGSPLTALLRRRSVWRLASLPRFSRCWQRR